MNELNEMGCAGVADAAAELALGVLPGRERARVLAHLDGCGACRKNVRQLTITRDALLELLPGSEPPLGFETGMVARTGLSRAVPGAGARTAGEGQQAGRAGAGRVVSRRAFGWRRVLAVLAAAALGCPPLARPPRSRTGLRLRRRLRMGVHAGGHGFG
jgi:hypothetical protein